MTTNLPECAWRKSSYSGESSHCVELACGSAQVGIRDSQARGEGAVRVARTSFAALLAAL